MGLLLLKRKEQTKGRKYVVDRRKISGRDTRGTAGLWAVTDVFSNSMSPASTGNTGKQDRPTKMIGVRDCKVAEKLPLLASHHNYYHLSRTHCIFHKNIVKSMAFVYLSRYGSSGDLNFLVPKSLWLLVSFLASFAHPYTYHFVPNTEVLKCCYFSLRRAATRGKDACGEVFLSTSRASSVSKKKFIILPSIGKVAWFILSHKIY